MRNRKQGVVLTTINGGDVLTGYCERADVEGVKDDLNIIVIPDRKSPPELYAACEHWRKRGFDIVCPAIADQEAFLAKVGPVGRVIPYNSDNRRNVGFLMALEAGCEVMISLDDDNYCPDAGEVFAAYSSVCGNAQVLPTIRSSDGWFNLCAMLRMEPDRLVYPRGFPYHKRHRPAEVTIRKEAGTVRLNAGLWLEHPDLDAITWLAAPVRAVAFDSTTMALGPDTWSPINTQNTSLHRDLITAYYFVKMGYPLGGISIDRYGDIYSGYFVQACMRQIGHSIRVGDPVAVHRRNRHNYLDDLKGELLCILALEDFTEWLPTVRLSGSTYPDAYLSLADAIADQVERFSGSVWNDAVRGYFHQMTYCMRQWVKACRILG